MCKVKAALSRLGVGCLLAALASVPATASVLFFDDFEGGSLSSWSQNTSGFIAQDISNSANHAVAFSSLQYGTDLIKYFDLTGVASITLSFDYMGVDAYSGLGTGSDTGGYVATFNISFAGTGGYPSVFSDLRNLTSGQWYHVSQTIEIGPSMRIPNQILSFEQWGGSPNPAGNAYFDNVLVEGENVAAVAPEPAALALSFSGLCALFLRSRLRRRP